MSQQLSVEPEEVSTTLVVRLPIFRVTVGLKSELC